MKNDSDDSEKLYEHSNSGVITSF